MLETLTSYAVGMSALAALAVIRIGVERTRQRVCRRSGTPDESGGGPACLGCVSHSPDAVEEEEGSDGRQRHASV